ncbi:MAG: AAA-associated domain-containing protein [Theionarchaea archaeon]|nr:AAA-associated domain-containing protein [Theionarchaea archaeon]
MKTNDDEDQKGRENELDEGELQKVIKKRENEIRKKCTDYEYCVMISEMLAEEIPKLSSMDDEISFLGESIKINPMNEDEDPKTPDLTFAYGSRRKGILIEIKSSLPNRNSADFEANMLNRLSDLKKYFQEMKEFDRHEVWLIVSEHDYGSVIEFLERNYQQLDFLKNSPHDFSLWYFCTKDKRNKDGLYINHVRGEILCPLISQQRNFYSERILLLGKKTYFVSQKPPAVEYTMKFILEMIIPCLESLVERGEYRKEEFLYLSREELMERIRSLKPLTISGNDLNSEWIKDALEKLSQINVLKKDDSTGTSRYGFPLKFRSRRIGPDIYKDFAEKETAFDFGLRVKPKETEGVSPTKMPYVPNADALPIVRFVEAVAYHGGLTTIDTLKNTLHKENIHHERKCSDTLGFTESPFMSYVRITDLGSIFADSDEFTKKKIFHEQALKTVKLYRTIYDNLSEDKGLNPKKIQHLIQEERKRAGLRVYGDSSIPENTRTLMNWLVYTGNAKRRREIYFLCIPSAIPTRRDLRIHKEKQLSLNDFF